MGYYIQCDKPKNKAQQIIEAFDAIEITKDEAGFFVKEGPDNCAVICVVDNGAFEAAAYCYSPAEFVQFSRPEDDRRKTWLLVEDATRVKTLTGYNR